MTRCPCCEIREAEVACKGCGRTVCPECLRVADKTKCYCGVSCAQVERDWQNRKRKK